MYEELKAKIAELEKRNTDAQELTQKQIEKFQERTADSEELSEMYKDVTISCNSRGPKESHLNYLNSDDKNTLATTHHIFTFKMQRHFIPGKPSSEGMWLHNKQKISVESTMKNGKCSICKNNQAKYAYKNDKVIFPFKITAEIAEGVLVPIQRGDYEAKFGDLNTLCQNCILNFKLENTTYVEPPKPTFNNPSTASSGYFAGLGSGSILGATASGGSFAASATASGGSFAAFGSAPATANGGSFGSAPVSSSGRGGASRGRGGASRGRGSASRGRGAAPPARVAAAKPALQ